MTSAPNPVTATVDLAAIRANVRALAQRCGLPVLAALKANAYGHGVAAVARDLEAAELVEMFGVATVAEGQELRRAGVRTPILKLSHCFADELPAALAAELTLTVVDGATIEQAEQAAAASGRTVPVHLKIDTGMGRIGAPAEQAAELVGQVDASPHLDLEGLFTHLPASDDPDQHRPTREQLDQMLELHDRVAARRGPVRYLHAANSGAVIDHDLSGFTLARPGIAIYGQYPSAQVDHEITLRPALELGSRLSFVKPVTRGTSIGYGRTWQAPRDTVIGTVPVGYADGYSRLLSNRGRMLVNGRPVPIVGRVCMDQTMVDLGPGASDQVGDAVVLVGRSGDHEITVDELAELMGTINYEVGCLLTGRVERVHRNGV